MGGILVKVNLLNKKVVFFIFLLFSFVVQYRVNTYFFFDEWDLLNSFAEKGLSAIFIPHNEHFEPLFFTFYYFENKLFGDSYSFYIFVNLILHSLTGVSLFCFLNRLGKGARKLSFLISLCFVINYLHSENLQWAFEQCIILQNLLNLLAFNLAWDFVVYGGLARLILVSLCCVLAPLFFGNGLILPLQVGVVVFLSAIFVNTDLKDERNFKIKIISAIKLLLSCVVFFTLAAVLYSTHKNPEKTYDLLHYPIHSLKYLYVTSSLGTFLRGLGLFPILDFPQLESFFGEITDKKLVNFSHLGLLVNFLMLFILVRNAKNKIEGFRNWLIGNAIIASSMLLPALGRSIYHLHQGLYLRYYSLNLVGLSIICFFIFKDYSQFERRKKYLSQFLLFCYFIIQVSQARNYVYFTKAGIGNLSYAQKLTDNIQRISSDSNKSVVQAHSEEDISKMDPRYVYRALSWLNPTKYPHY